MLDRIHAGVDGEAGGLVAVAMRRHPAVPPVCLGDDRGELFGSELRHIDRVGLGKHLQIPSIGPHGFTRSGG